MNMTFQGFTLSDEQENCLDQFSQLEPNQSLVIEAGAGASKTYTSNAISTLLCGRERGLYLAYNDLIVQEIKGAFPASVDVFTTHGLAYHYVGKRYRNRLKQRITSPLLIKTLGLTGGVGNLTSSQFAYLVLNTMNKYCLSNSESINAEHVIAANRYGLTITPTLSAMLIKYATLLFEKMSSPQESVPITHDFYLKLFANYLAQGKLTLNYSYVILDESQDSPAVTQLIINHINAYRGKVLVGDSNQAIYEWRGATNAMQSMQADRKAELTKCFRFGNNVAEIANQVLKRFAGKDTKLIGNENINTRLITEEGNTDDKTILCRTNATLMTELMKSVEQNRVPYLMKKAGDQLEIAHDIERLRNGEQPKSVELANFNSWLDFEEYSQSDIGGDLKPMVNAVNDYGISTIIETLAQIKDNRIDAANDVIGTGHSSKGTEFKHVKLANDYDKYLNFSRPSAKTNPEAYLTYVSLTRCKTVLDISECHAINALSRKKTPKRARLEAFLAS